MKFIDLLENPNALTTKCVLVSTLNFNEPHNALKAFAQLYDLALAVTTQFEGSILKQTGSSIYMIFNDPAAAQSAATVHQLEAAKQDLGCSLGIALGQMIWFQTAQQSVDYLGEPLRRARELSLLGAKGAVFCDAEIAANFAIENQYHSFDSGARGNQKVSDYVELIWADQAFGLRQRAVSRVARTTLETPAKTSSSEAVQANTSNQAQISQAQVSTWWRGTILRIGEKFGFITAQNGEVVYFQPSNLAILTDLSRGAEVIFKRFPPAKGAQAARAEDVFVVNATATGRLESVNKKAGWGLVKLDCHNGLSQRLVVLGIRSNDFSKGKQISFRIMLNNRGPVGVSPSLLLEPELLGLTQHLVTANIPQMGAV
jgi:cold shock CspA family protein